MKHRLVLVTIIALSACRPSPPPAPEPVDAGADAPDQCVHPVPRSDYLCTADVDCYDRSPCTEDRCVAGVCTYAALPDGTACDVSPMTDVCQQGACCARVEVFEGPR